MVDPNQIEMLSDRCIRLWCHQHNINDEEVIRECTLYLKPNDAGNSIQDLLTGDFQPFS